MKPRDFVEVIFGRGWEQKWQIYQGPGENHSFTQSQFPSPEPPPPPASSLQAHVVWEFLPHTVSSTLKANAGRLCPPEVKLNSRGGFRGSAREAEPLHSLSQMALVVYELELSSSRARR